MKLTGAEIMVKCLAEEGVDNVVGRVLFSSFVNSGIDSSDVVSGCLRLIGGNGNLLADKHVHQC